jgi:choline dehydrogenase-like flavoprotein
MRKNEYRQVIVVGSGAAGGTIVRELVASGKDVLLLECGSVLRKITKNGIYIKKNGREKILKNRTSRESLPAFRHKMELLFDRSGFLKTTENNYFYQSRLLGGSTWVIAGNALQRINILSDKFGFDLENHYREAEKDLFVSTIPDMMIGPRTRQIMNAARILGHRISPVPKTIDFNHCRACGLCILGCPYGAKWNAGRYISEAESRGADVRPGMTVTSVITTNNSAVGVMAVDSNGCEHEFYSNAVVISAGAINTSILLKNSGFSNSGNTLFFNLAQTTLGVIDKTGPAIEFQMSVVFDEMLDQKGFMIFPYFHPDPMIYLVDHDRDHIYTDMKSLLKRQYKMVSLRNHNVISLLTIIRDTANGTVDKNGTVSKYITESDRRKLDEGAEISRNILIQAGISPSSIIRGRIVGSHPGGGAAMGSVVNRDFSVDSVSNLFVCDASVFPDSIGTPPLLSIVAFSKYFSKKLASSLN